MEKFIYFNIKSIFRQKIKPIEGGNTFDTKNESKGLKTKSVK